MAIVICIINMTNTEPGSLMAEVFWDMQARCQLCTAIRSEGQELQVLGDELYKYKYIDISILNYCMDVYYHDEKKIYIHM